MTAPVDFRAAQLLTVGFPEKELSDDLKRLIDRGVFGVILFSRNIEAPKQVADLVSDIKRFAGRPLVVGVDQEGGVVARLRRGFTRVPPMRALGRVGDERIAERVGRMLGRELRAVGIDWDFAPVLDVDTNPDNPVIGNRSISHDPEVVARLGVAIARGMEAEGVASCGKHFPGHGDTSQDSHRELPRLLHGMARLEQVELGPFRAAARAGLASVMTAHVLFEKLDGAVPATMSREVLQGILRDRLGYGGLVVSDDIEMKALADHYGWDEIAVRGVIAGLDNFLCCHTAEVAHEVIDSIVRGVASGAIPIERLDDASRRLEGFACRFASPPAEPRLEVLQCDEHVALVEHILDRVGSEAKELGVDPTEFMDRILAERTRHKP